MYTVETIPNNNSREFLDFCKKSFESTDKLSRHNMWHDDWQNRPETLPYLVYKSDRFANNNGIFLALRVDGALEAVSGIYISEFDKNVAIGGVRSWTNEGFRADLIIGRHIFPKQILWAKEHGVKSVALTFNEYNRKLINYFTRNGAGVVKNRTPDMMFYNGVHEVPFPVVIQNTKQWAIYHRIDESYSPNWHLIEYIE